MPAVTRQWDYLIVTAANREQAAAYEFQIQRRHQAGDLPQVRQFLVIPDLDGHRIGSGGSTLHCLWTVLQREGHGSIPGNFKDVEAILSRLRILIVHAGGDSRRLPAYSHCGKMFVPLPGKIPPSPATTLFDRLVPTFLALPESATGQILVASGDALILTDGSGVDFSRPGITALGAFGAPEEASHHGVFCPDHNGVVRRFLQKPSPAAQADAGAVNEEGKSILDLGVMNCDAATAVGLMRAFFEINPEAGGRSKLNWQANARRALFSGGIDLYREICCALGTETTLDEYVDNVRASGSTMDRALLTQWFAALRDLPFHLNVLPHCHFLHFGTTRQLITSGLALLTHDLGNHSQTSLVLNSAISAKLSCDRAWVEGCSVSANLTLDGGNAVVGVDVIDQMRLGPGACIDISAGVSRSKEKVWFFRYYGIDDTFKHSAEQRGTFSGLPLATWLNAMSARPADIWAAEVPESERTLWNARVFPALNEHQEFREWLWLLDVVSARDEQKRKFVNAERYSSSEIALGVDQAAFHARRSKFAGDGPTLA